MKKLWLSCVLAWVLACSASAADAASRLDFAPPVPGQRDVIARVLGDAFLRGVGVFPAETLVAAVDLNGDRSEDMVAVQKGFCSNHACTFHFLVHEPSGEWREAAAVESWAIPCVLDGAGATMRDLVIFDHLTDDCLSCSPPKPVRLAWRQRAGAAGGYAAIGPVPKDEATVFAPSWCWSGQK
ncbi:hypothetical protein DND132_2696 [Pseudodesulfovibrio mercurii]|uniref:Lipoprotein n=1 Tax=Pseudodesulfovibrio mercurii TaxID=641491 RepID=F0JJ00_9BACT|nr:hypothetical protein [Pseudodesulfovibrio mercurii]EGB15899.1 hypothetical protein DND132_2696 [Pseudodesulfovibrio mercurii]